jgi:glycosyltransferase involved in cell wall biosynthesis
MAVLETEPFMVDDGSPFERRMRLAVVSETWPPEVNGVAQTIARVVEGLRERGHAVQLVRPRQGPQDTAVAEQAPEPGAEDEGPDWHEVLMRGLPIPRYPQLKMGLPAQRALLALWKRRRPDCVHIVTEGPLGWSALAAARKLELPTVSEFRTNFHAYSRHYGMPWLAGPIAAYLRKFHNRTLCTMVPTAALKAELAAQGFRNLHVVARGVDTLRFAPERRSVALRRSWGADAGTLVALYVGRLAPEKNLDLLLSAWAALRAQRPDARLVLVGDGPAVEDMKRRCPEAHFAGVQRGESLAAHYASGDLFLFPSRTETYGNVVPEAMASGVPVLAFDLAAAGELIEHGRNGLLVRDGDDAGFLQLAAHLGRHPGELPPLGGQARRTAEAMAWSRIVEQVEQHQLSAVRSVWQGLPGERWPPALPPDASAASPTTPPPPRTA